MISPRFRKAVNDRGPKQSCHNFANGCQLLRVAQVSTKALIGR